jgi:L-alanine-DL-glutamate epimerase-like enolase superfamily enzyme
LKIGVHIEHWPTIQPFRISGKTWNAFESVVVELQRNGVVGRGEALGVYYLGETAESMLAQIRQVSDSLTNEIDRHTLQRLLPSGGARNAIDSALWDLEAKSEGRSIWDISGVQPKALETVFTIGIEQTPEEMAAKAAAATAYELLKVKLDEVQPAERLEAIRRARPDARMLVDANQGWTFDQLKDLAPLCATLGVQLIEQPLRRGADAELQHYASPVPLCADESCLHLDELEQAASRYDWVNIKLDKTGGLTHALALAQAARKRGLNIMVGSMGGSSLAMAPSFVIGCLSDLVDIDGPLLQQSDRIPGLVYKGGWVSVFEGNVWG